MAETPDAGEHPRPTLPHIEPPPTGFRTVILVRWGMVLWTLVLLLTLAVPALRTGDRSWWPWVPVAALGLGLIGLTYLGRGRGNASDA